MSSHTATGTVSARARDGLEHFLEMAIKSVFAAPGAPCTLRPVIGDAALQQQLVMLTVASYRFRLLLLIHFDQDRDTRAHFAALAGADLEAMVGESFIDEVMERGNLCCGALNRTLSAYFPHIGMSTPRVLNHLSLEHAQSLAPSMTQRYCAEVGSDLVLHFTVILCASGDMDFAYEPHAAVQADSAGELEIF